MTDKAANAPLGLANGVPLRPALASVMSLSGGVEDGMSPKSGPTKVVSINDQPEHISPMIPPLDGPSKQFSAGIGKRLAGRSPNMTAMSSRTSFFSQQNLEELPPSALSSDVEVRPQAEQRSHHHHNHIRHQHEKLLTQVAEWLQAEKAKRASRKAKKHSVSTPTVPNDSVDGVTMRPRTGSQSSTSSTVSLEKLQRIIEENMTSFTHTPLPPTSPSLRPRMGSLSSTPRRKSSMRQLIRTVSSDTEYQDGDVIVPSCDVVLDNSKTLSFSGGNASTTDLTSTSKRAEKERKAWSGFKGEILRLAHTLRLKGWRRIPLDSGNDIDVERLSGALTNAVYVVSPPKNIPPPSSSSSTGLGPKKPPPKLLLRIYGPQVEHLIDRENELGILRRLARKKIGPRLLGTFRNGRFEEYFASTTLTAADLRVPETSKQIAKRMRELHDGIDLLAQEREDGAFVWRNWDKWVDRCELVIKFLDDQILTGKCGKARGKAEAWKERGLICGVQWKLFRAAIEKYREFLIGYYGGEKQVHRRLVFAHNDTQYGNILRLNPSGESPLLLPANSHKQLVVIDFEYASANTPGLEFANHFTEWCYNYHDAQTPHVCNTHLYPTLEEQRRFIRSYINHRPQFNPRASATPKMTPKQTPTTPSAGSISEFLLDSRTPNAPGGSSGYDAEEAAREKETERQVEELVTEARLWRVANSAQWVAWGIVQAKVPELDENENTDGDSYLSSSIITDTPNGFSSSPLPLEAGDAELMTDPQTLEAKQHQDSHDHDQRPEEGHGEDEDEFDYLGYAQERAMFFWGDVVELGLVRREELPVDVVSKLKVVRY